jgi:hypothetical protein
MGNGLLLKLIPEIGWNPVAKQFFHGPHMIGHTGHHRWRHQQRFLA